MKQFNIEFPREVCCHCFINKYKRRDNLFVFYLAKMNEFEKNCNNRKQFGEPNIFCLFNKYIITVPLY